MTMGFKQLLAKVQQAEAALEARERRVSHEWDHLKTTWRAAWTPGRVIIAGLASGFLVGRAQPLRAAARSGQWMQLVTMLSGLFAGGSAQVAAEEAEAAAETSARAAGAAEAVAETVAPAAAPVHAPAQAAPHPPTGP
ncbi:hypothetical protein [Lysobacter solisilvae (ex Woo and Kim 2020)]|uniref:Protein sip-5 n=1 Tax=Agrilutibacter terrestris TaxID=2865112 RepID=A0A7H0FUK3_9GAMM|nr:hypothetical protein [Lysobacter terrestris]QNP39719.1 hypothetical protein H8B22_09340 [Lysobacter terrestris]